MTGSGTDTYRAEIVEASAGDFVEVYDADHSEDEPAAFLSAEDAREMAETILAELDGDSRE